MAVKAYAPDIPGVTEPAAWERNAPEALRAIRKTNDDGTERTPDDRAKSLLDVAKAAFLAHDWAYRERIEILAMTNGAQFGFWHKALRRFVSVQSADDDNIIRIPINRIRPAREQAKAMLTAERPIFGSAAATSEGSDLASAEAGDALNEWGWRYHDLGALYEDTADGAFGDGTSFLLQEWDPTIGPFVPGEPTEDENGVLTSTLEPQGDHKFTLLQGDQVAFDPTARRPKDGPCIHIRRRLSRAYLAEAFPDKKDALSKQSKDDDFEEDEGYVNRYSPATGRSDADPEHSADTIEVFTTYYAATRDMPQGAAFIYTSGGVSLHEGDNDVYPTAEEIAAGEQWPNIRWPVFTFVGDRRGNSPWGRGRVLDAIPIQKAINGAFSKAVQHVALIANAKPYLPKGVDFKWSDSPGQVIRYSRAYQPGSFGYLSAPQMHQGYFQVYETGKEAINNVMGINDASQGSSPTSDASGRLAEQLQNRDDTRIAPVKARLDATWAEVMTYYLRLFRRFATSKRRIQVVGENGATALKFFDKSSLAAGTDVMCFNDQSIPRDPTRRMVWLMNFSTMIANAKDEQQRALLLDLARLRDFKGYLEKQSPHRVKAIRFNRMLELGEIPLPDPWDHALTHRATLEEFLCSETYAIRVAEQEQQFGESELAEAAGWLWQHWSEKLAAEMNPQGPPPGAPAPPPMPGGGVPQAGLATPEPPPPLPPNATPEMTVRDA